MNPKQPALDFLNTLLGQRLRTGAFMPQTGIFRISFGRRLNTVTVFDEEEVIYTHTLRMWHTVRIIAKEDPWEDKTYTLTTNPAEFEADVNCLRGRRILQGALSERNDLLLDLGSHYIICTTNDNGLLSWMYYISPADSVKLIASAKQLKMTG